MCVLIKVSKNRLLCFRFAQCYLNLKQTASVFRGKISCGSMYQLGTKHYWRRMTEKKMTVIRKQLLLINPLVVSCLSPIVVHRSVNLQLMSLAIMQTGFYFSFLFFIFNKFNLILIVVQDVRQHILLLKSFFGTAERTLLWSRS